MPSFRRLKSFGSINVLLIVVFFVLYSVVTFYLMGQQQNCLSVREIASQIRSMQLEDDHRKSSPTQTVSTSSTGAGEKNDPNEPIIGRHLVTSANTTTSKKPSFFAHDELPQTLLLNRRYAPNTVYYVWCGTRWFEFPHYLSVRSVIKHLRPDNLVFYYDVYPVVDSWLYNTWLSEIIERYPFFRTQQLDPNEHGCDGYEKPSAQFVYGLLTKRGGTYVNEMTIFAKFPVEYRGYDVVAGVEKQNAELSHYRFVMTRPGYPGIRTLNGVMEDKQLRIHSTHCASRDGFVKANRKSWCVFLTTSMFPKDIWEMDNSFGRLVRTIFYETPNILRPVPTYDDLIPNIAHVVWLGGGPMDFLFYLTILSLIHMAKVDAVYLHGDGPPTGSYWDLVKNEEKLHLIYRESPVKIYGTDVKVLSHVTDIWRVDFMIKYGGIYVDTDTIFVRPLDRETRGYEAVGSYDWTYWNHPFPDTINYGVALGKRNARYWHLFQESMKWFVDSDWAWNGLRQPYKIKERHPDLVLIDPHLQVICYLAKCHPTWWPDYHNESIHHLNSNSITDWKTQAYAFHWTLPTPYELLNHTTLITTNTLFSVIAKAVLEKANMLDYFQKLVQTERGPLVQTVNVLGQNQKS